MAALVCVGRASAAGVAGPSALGPLRPRIGAPVRPTEFRGDVRRIPRGNLVPREESEARAPGDVPPSAGGDAALQTGGVLAPTPAPLQSFPGLNHADWGAGWPPDPNGDAGPDYYVQTVNTSVGIFDKRAGARIAAFTFDSLFGQAPTGTPCDNQNQGDPVALYDTIGRRWIVSDFAWSNYTSGPMYQCMAVSKTSDPVAGGWWFYAWQTGTGGSVPDYPKLGVWPDGIYMSANLFATNAGGSFQNLRVWAFDRAGMEAGQPAQSVSFVLPKTVGGISVFSLLPSNAHLPTGLPPTGRPNFFASIWGAYAIRVWRFHVDWQTPASSTFTGPTNVPVATFNVGPSTVPEKEGNSLDTLTYRLMMHNQYANLNGTESLWLSHTVGTGGIARPRWYELGVTGGAIASLPAQQSTWAPDAKHRFMPSLALDRNGDMALGYSLSDATMYPSIRYAARLAGDPANTLGQSETSLVEGTGFQCCNFSDGSTNERWGDYSSMSIDPDGCTFWYTNQYYTAHPTVLAQDDWQTRIGSFRLAGCSSAGYHTVGRVTCNTSTPRFSVGAPTVFGYGSGETQYVLWRTLFAHFDGISWTLGAETPFLAAATTAASPADQWYALTGEPVGSSASLAVTADSGLAGYWVAVEQTVWLTSTGALVTSDTQLAETPGGNAALAGTPACYWPDATSPPAPLDSPALTSDVLAAATARPNARAIAPALAALAARR
jgi:hypothetical protein